MGFILAQLAGPAVARVAAAVLAASVPLLALADATTFRPRTAKAGLRSAQAVQIAEQAAAPAHPLVERLIVTPHPTRGGKLNWQLQQKNASRLQSLASVPLSVERKLTDGSHLLRLEQPITVEQARALAAQLQQSGEVQSAEPDLMMQPQMIAPNDPGYASWPGQWHYLTPGGINRGGAGVPAAWALTLGSGNVNVAVIDTGYRPHVDLQTMLPGHDFISSTTVANDGNGRDADASDPGDYSAAGACGTGSTARQSSWHGTHVIGTIAALMDNGLYGTGIAPHVRILPVRALGRCGGYTSDIVDSIRWAAGIDVGGVPRNLNPARIINLSLGSTGSCSAAFQSAINDANARGAIVVVATGNGGANTVNQPANCSGVIAVTAHTIDGDNADYANIGAETTISAPGGGCGTLAMTCVPGYTADGPPVYSLGNTGTAAPLADSAALKYGTSMAAPHVVGTVALMLSVNPALTRAEVTSLLRSAARPFTAGSTCTLTENSGLCGAGLLDAQAALAAVAPIVQIGVTPQVVAPAAVVALSGSAQPPSGRTIVRYQWRAASSNPVSVTLLNPDAMNTSFIAPATGTYAFTLTATDDRGISGSASATVRVNSVPVLQPVAAQHVAYGGRVRLQLQATDSDGDALVFHAAALPTGASLSASGQFSWNSAAPVGNHRIIWHASDAYGSSLPGEFFVEVADSSGSTAAVPAGGGGGGSMTGDLMLLAGGVLALARRWRRR